MLTLFNPVPSAAVISCRLDCPALAYLEEHRVSRRGILPGAAMFEIAYAASAILAAGDVSGCMDRVLLANSTIAAPFLLSQAASSSTKVAQDRPPALVCKVQAGLVSLSSQGGSLVHLNAATDFLAIPSSSSAAATSTSAKCAEYLKFNAEKHLTGFGQQVGLGTPADSFDGALGGIDIQVGHPHLAMQ